MGQTAKRRTIAVLLLEDLQLLDAAGPIEVFAQANRRAGGEAYEIVYVAPRPTVRTTSGLTLGATPLAQMRRPFHTLLIPGGPEPTVRKALADAKLMRWIARNASAAARVASVCSGAFLLAELGLLDGKRATTHWIGLDALAAAYPKIRVERDALFVEDGRVWTSAGVASGIDLALALVARDLGRDLALKVARDLVLHLVRPGGQSQFSGPLALQTRARDDLARLIPWLESRLDREITTAAMADAMGMSERTFHRRCVASFGKPPAKVVSELRLERARVLLGDRIPIQTVASQCGFADPAAFTVAFGRRFGASPSAYQRAFTAPARNAA
jgi:transcriptional regulator GlxA family with amidase domain